MTLRSIVGWAIFFSLVSQVRADTDIFIADASWKSTNAEPPAGWNTSLAFDDSSWAPPVVNPGGIVLNGDPTLSLWADGTDPCAEASFYSWFRRVINVPNTPGRAVLSIGVDDDAAVYVNGILALLDESGSFSVVEVDVAPYLVSGDNLIAVQTADTAGGCHGFGLRLAISDSCGNLTIDAGEDCDDGNLSNGDCCSADCHAEVGNACSDGDPCTLDQCNASGTCGTIPTGCKTAAKSMLLLKQHSSDDAKDKLIWKWIKGDATDAVDFGSPDAATEHILCLQSNSASGYVTIPPGSNWQAIGTKGFKFKSTSPGPQKAILKSGSAGRAKAQLLAKGSPAIDALLAPTMDVPVIARLINNSTNACFESLYLQTDVIKNEDGSFKAKAQ